MNRLQRHVLVVALGAVCLVVGVGVNQLWSLDASGGWFMYAPDSDSAFRPSAGQGTVFREGVVWMLAIAAWASVACWLYRDADRQRD